MRKLVNILAIGMFTLGVAALIHQNFTTTGGWFNWEQLWHHESLAALCFVSSISLLVGRYVHSKFNS